MKKMILTVALAASAMVAWADTPLWLRDVKISPDGTQIAFTYKGDIYKVPVGGGTAVRLTTLPSYESVPVWSPDGSKIAFTSDRNGGSDIYIMGADGGQATRLTYDSSADTPQAFTPDGSTLLFTATIQDPATSAAFPGSRYTELYSVPVDGGRFKQLLAVPVEKVHLMPDGKSFLYQDKKGGEDEWRKHHTSSITRDICLYDAKTGRHTNLTNRPGEDRDPVLSPDGNTVYFLSEPKGGTMNVYSFALSDPSRLTKVTDFTTHPVRFLSQGSNGTMAFGYDGEIYTMRPGAKPVKVNIDIIRDDDVSTVTLPIASGINGASVSPDGKQIAFTKRGVLFVTSVEYPSVKQISENPEGAREIAWAPDNRTIVYVSDRSGHWNLYQAKIARDDDPNFSNATLVDEIELFSSDDDVERTAPSFSPDGKQLAFIKDRDKLMIMDVASKKVRQLTDGSTVTDRGGSFDYKWSPDGKWIAMEAVDRRHAPYSDVAIVNVATGEMTNLTNSGYFDDSPRWVLDGNAIMYSTDRYGMRAHASWGSQRDIMLVFLNQNAYDRYRLSEEDYALLKDVEKAQKKSKSKPSDDKKGKSDKKTADTDADKKADAEPIVVELDGIDQRTVRVTPNSADIADAIITKDGETLYYLAAFEGGYDLWKINLRKRGAKLASKLDAGYLKMDMDKDGKNIFLLGSSSMKKMDAKSEKVTPVTVSGTMTFDPAREREYMFNQVYRQEREKFYTPTMHGVDWDAMTAAYRRFLPHIDNNYDFAELLSELLGELNVSHTGGRYTAPAAKKPTASLGLLFDLARDGDGLLVTEVLEGGPFDRATSDVRAGNVVEKINGEPIKADTDFIRLLNGIARKKTLVSFYDPKSGRRWDEVILPITTGAQSDLLYARWVRNNEAYVDSLSGGRLGYVHIESMNDDSFREVYAKVLGKFNDREGIVIDTRWNGGGRLHEDIEVFFSGKKYFTQVVRGKETCDMPSRRWNKPSIMVQGEANYSNAHGTPWVYKHVGLGKLVGMPVPGTMTSVNWMRLQDPSLVYGIPVTGYLLPDGSYLENSQLEPDIKIANDPATIVLGEDRQLKAAVAELLKEIKK